MPGLALANDIIVALRRSGWKALLVGGCVRDRLLGIEPKDYDVATDARPDELLRILPRSQPVGAHFGVVLVPGQDAQVEVATFRSEGQYSDGRRPDAVQFVTEPAEDARRRDFTINGLFEDPLSGEILDTVGGQADLQAGVIRAIGDAATRFQEDHLRMLRAVRFAARLGFEIETGTLAAIRQEALQIHKISAERIREELIRILTQGHAHRGVALLDESGLLEQVLPEIKAFHGVQQPPEFHPEGDVWTHVMLMLEHMREPEPALALGVLLHDVAKPATFRVADRIRFDGHAELGAEMTRQILARLKFSNDEIDQAALLVENHMKFKDVRKMRLSTLKRFLRLPHFEQHMELHRLDCLASNGRTDSYDFVREKQAEFGVEQLRPPRLLNGMDLIRAGFQPGPLFGQALELVESAQLEGEVKTAEEALELARSVL
jgi:poly(A) polymerase